MSDNAKVNGGPAFPLGYTGCEPECNPCVFFGMSLRDYFAAKEISHPPISWWQARIGSHTENEAELSGGEIREGLAAWRFQCADAMIAARNAQLPKRTESQRERAADH